MVTAHDAPGMECRGCSTDRRRRWRRARASASPESHPRTRGFSGRLSEIYLQIPSSRPARPYFMGPSGVAIRLITGGSRFETWRAHSVSVRRRPAAPASTGTGACVPSTRCSTQRGRYGQRCRPKPDARFAGRSNARRHRAIPYRIDGRGGRDQRSRARKQPVQLGDLRRR